MWNRDFFKKLIQVAPKNYGMAIADSISIETPTNPSLTVGSLITATAKTCRDMKEHVADCDEARYFLFVQTFLETAEIDQEQFNQFMDENPDNVKFGLQALKLLENVTIEEQAKMLSTNLSLRANKEIDDTEYNENIFIIMRLDSYLIDKFKEYINYQKPKSTMSGAIRMDESGTYFNPAVFQTDNMFYHPPMDFVSFGFLEQEVPKHMTMATHNGIQRNPYYLVTKKARKFYEKFFKEIDKKENVPNTQSFNYRRF